MHWSSRKFPFSHGVIFYYLSLNDFILTTWHNFLGLVMISVALLWQISYLDRGPSWIRQRLPALIFLGSLIGFCTVSLPFLYNILDHNRSISPKIASYNQELATLQTFIDRERIVAIPPLTAVAWTGFRYTFYPRGLTNKPQGIADFAITPVNLSQSIIGNVMKGLPLDNLKSDFEVIKFTPHFILLKRTAITETQRATRQQFFQMSPLFPDSFPR